MTAPMPLTNNELIAMAPAIGAESPIMDVSDKYTFVPTTTALDILRDAGWMPYTAEQSRVRDEEKEGYQTHLIRLFNPNLIFTGERYEIILFNSHDKGCSFWLMGGFFRFVCSNKTVTGDKDLEFRHKHIGFEAEQFFQSAAQLANSANQAVASIEHFKGINMGAEQKMVLAKQALDMRYPDGKAPIDAIQLLKPHRYEDTDSSLWTTFNVIQENMVRGGLRGRSESGRRMTTRPINSIRNNINVNRGLWNLTQGLADTYSEGAFLKAA